MPESTDGSAAAGRPIVINFVENGPESLKDSAGSALDLKYLGIERTGCGQFDTAYYPDADNPGSSSDAEFTICADAETDIEGWKVQVVKVESTYSHFLVTSPDGTEHGFVPGSSK